MERSYDIGDCFFKEEKILTIKRVNKSDIFCKAIYKSKEGHSYLLSDIGWISKESLCDYQKLDSDAYSKIEKLIKINFNTCLSNIKRSRLVKKSAYYLRIDGNYQYVIRHKKKEIFSIALAHIQIRDFCDLDRYTNFAYRLSKEDYYRIKNFFDNIWEVISLIWPTH